MKCRYGKYFREYTFNKETNELETNLTRIETEIQYKDFKSYRHYFWFMFKIMIGFLLVIWAFVLASGFSSSFDDPEFITGVVCCTPASLVFAAICLTLGIKGHDLELTKEEILEAYKNNAEYIELQKHNEKELYIMEEWRANHPFEEKVRKALESRNGNDVSDVIKMILERETI